ncbi:amino acid transporter, partial [Hafnia paralvei]|nr:amino acid transporter [Hafnia paralvei]
TIFFAVLPFLIYLIRKPHWRDENSDFAPFTWQVESGHPGIQNVSSAHTGDVVTAPVKTTEPAILPAVTPKP